MTAWCVIAAGDRRRYGGHLGYADIPDSQYVWDSSVPHHRDLNIGDHIVLWDKEWLIGASVIDAIDTSLQDKPIHRCPVCYKISLRAPRKRNPNYTCIDCKLDIPKPDVSYKQVVQYKAHFEARWIPLAGLLSGSEIRLLCEKPQNQHAIRILKWKEFVDTIERKQLATGIHLLCREPTGLMPAGYRETVVRSRIGQGGFRAGLLALHGENCAFTGRSSGPALDAAHLYSYAQHQEHDLRAGMMLRKDVHALFDRGLIFVDPIHLRIRVHPQLLHVESYSRLDGCELRIEWPSKSLLHALRIHKQTYHSLFVE